MELTYTRNGTAYSVTVEKLPEKAVAYLLQYGFSQSLQDAIAGDAKRIKEKMIAEANEAGNSAPTDEEVDTAVKAGIDEALNDRVKAISDGTVGDRVGIVRDPFATACRTYALELLRAGLKAQGVKFPQDADKVKELVAGVIERNKERVEKEARRRMKASQDTGVVELPPM